jgi:polysaccharide deacetylase family protein (PEP-CTERM system associated)
MVDPRFDLKPIAATPEVNMLSVDVECWHHLVYGKLTGKRTPCSALSDGAIHELLSLLKNKGAKATFFVHGPFAEDFPDTIRRIESEGHEIATHGYSHAKVNSLTREEFRKEVRLSVELLSELVEKPPIGFRAAEFSIVEESYWALDILAQEGIKYDSSVFPIAGRRYGISDFPRGPVRAFGKNGSIVEVPLSTVRRFERNWPVAGGGYLRLMPYGVIKKAVQAVNSDGFPFVLYCHPYEFLPERLSLRKMFSDHGKLGALKFELPHNLLRKTMRGKLEKLLDDFKFSSIKEVLAGALDE